MKGYEIYSWQSPPGHWHYALLVGTNRLKFGDEILSAAISEAELRVRLGALSPLENVSWCPPAELKAELEAQPALESPPKAIVDSLVAFARTREIALWLCDPETL